MDYRLGIDVGGTNTDAVLMCGSDVVEVYKSFTTADVFTGTVDAVTGLLQKARVSPAEIGNVMIGTTQFVNAFVQRQGLTEVAAIRISLPKGDGIPPLCGWPEDLKRLLGGHVYEVGGGAYYTGKDYAPLDEARLAAIGDEIRDRGIPAVAITANFAMLRPDLEERAANIVRARAPAADITLSAQIGGQGLIDRESASVVNACLSHLSRRVVSSIVGAFQQVGVRCRVFFSQNDGTLLPASYAERFPIFTCSAGPTNSMRGAAFLTNVQDAVVVDIGGTTSDVGFLVKGFPRETATAHYLGGVRTNFRMPDVLSIAVGGGSIVEPLDGGVTVGPRSVGFQLKGEALVFGGRTLTATDIAVAAGHASVGDAGRVSGLDGKLIECALDAIHARIEGAIDQMRTSSTPVPVILVGGGSILISRPLAGASQVLKPTHANVANAVGAAIALVSGRVDRLFDFDEGGRAAALARARSEAVQAAAAAGADPDTVEVVDLTELPMSHMKSSFVQVKVRAVGALARDARVA